MANTAGVANVVDPKKRVIAINGSAGAVVLISASIFAGYAEFQECPPSAGFTGLNYAPQGLNITRADENYANIYALNPGDIYQIGDPVQKNRCIGVPARTDADNTARPATPWVKVISASVTATQIEVREWRQR